MKSNRRGFTLIELLVVMAVIALLSSILFAVFTRVREMGRRTNCASNQKQILLALHLYIQDNNGRFLCDVLADIPHVWTDTLVDYTGDDKVFRCPSDYETRFHDIYWQSTSRLGLVVPKFRSSYIVNDRLAKRGRPGSQLKDPAATVFLTDGTSVVGKDAPFVTTSSPRLPSDAWFESSYLADPQYWHAGYANSFGPRLRHSGLSNVGFVDGHVKAMKAEDWYYKNTPYLTLSRP